MQIKCFESVIIAALKEGLTEEDIKKIVETIIEKIERKANILTGA